MDLSIIIVNYKSRAKLANCLESIAATEAGALSYEIIIVDNASGDNLEDIKVRWPKAKFIASFKNLGMGGGNNLGIEAARASVVLILNPDTLIRADALTVLFNYLKNNPAVGLVGPKLLNSDGSLQFSCSRFPRFFMPFLRRTSLGRCFKKESARFIMDDFDHNSVAPVDWLMGSCLMFRKEINLPDGRIFRPRFDERYFMYFEDTDLARQFWYNGLQVVYNPAAVVIHDHQRQSARYPWYLALFVDKLARWHISSWLKYFAKWGFKPHNYK
jgi:GT2 family glycosyltransferase